MISRSQRVDGLVVWDMICGTIGRRCPKLAVGDDGKRLTDVGPFRTPPACIYLFPAVIPSQANHHARSQELADVELLTAFQSCFQGKAEEVNYVDFEIAGRAANVVRKTTVRRGGAIQRESEMTAIRRV